MREAAEDASYNVREQNVNVDEASASDQAQSNVTPSMKQGSNTNLLNVKADDDIKRAVTHNFTHINHLTATATNN